MRLGVIDIQAPQATLFSAQKAEELGFHRYWLGEHHTRYQSASPIVLAAAVAASTHSIRVGTAGVFLRYVSPLKLIEDFALIEVVFGDRFDLGVIEGNVAPGWASTSLLDGRAQQDYDPTRLDELVRLSQAKPVEVIGSTGLSSKLWVCGTGTRSALSAARLGLRYAFHHYLAGNNLTRAQEVIESYLRHYHGDQPRIAVVCYGACGLSNSELPEGIEVRHLTFFGDPDSCRNQLECVGSALHATDLVVKVFAPAPSQALEQLAALADAFSLRRRAPDSQLASRSHVDRIEICQE